MDKGTQTEVTALGRLAARCYDRRRLVLGLWIVAIIGVTVLSVAVGTTFKNKFTAGNTPSQQAQNILQQRFPSKSGDTADIVFHTSTPISASRAAITGVINKVRPLPYVQGITSPFSPEGAHQIAPKGNIAYAEIQFTTDTADIPTGAVKKVISAAQGAATHGLQVELGGSPISAAATAAPGPSEGIGITAALLIMLLAFGSVVAMGLPVITALAGLGIGIALLELLTHLLTVPNFSPEMAIMIGLGVGIDYALFIVTRYRQGIFEGRTPREAVMTAHMTAGRSVMFAGSTVVISLFGLYLIQQPYMIGLATACIAAVLMVLLAALTLLPAMLGFAGNVIDKLHVPGLLQNGGPPPENGFWHRWSRFIQRRAWFTGTVAVLILVLLAIPLFSMRLAFTDAGNDPTSLTTRQAYDLLATGFGPGFNGPLVVAADMNGPTDRAIVEHLQRAIAVHHGGIAFVTPPEFNH